MPLYDYKIYPVEPPSPDTVALAFLNATQRRFRAMLTHHMSFVRPPAPRSHLRRLRVCFVSISISPAGVFAQTPRRHPFRLRREFCRSCACNHPAVLTADTDPINSRASGAGHLACFDLPLREQPCLGGKCQQARGCSWAFATMLGQVRQPTGRRPAFPVNGGPVSVVPVACHTSTGATGTGGLRGRGLTGVGLTPPPYLRRIETSRNGGHRKRRNPKPPRAPLVLRRLCATRDRV